MQEIFLLLNSVTLLRIIDPAIFLNPLLWVIAALFIFLYYRYNRKKRKSADILGSYKFLAIAGSTGLLAIAILFVNYILPPKKSINDLFEEAKETTSTYEGDQYFILKAEKDFFNLETHLDFIHSHFFSARAKDAEPEDESVIDNFYYYASQSNLREIADIGYWGMGICFYHENRFDEAIDSLQKVQNKEMHYLNYYLARSYEKLDIPEGKTMAIKHLARELALYPDSPGEFYNVYVELLIQNYKKTEIEKLLRNPKTLAYVPLPIARDIYFQQNDFINYFSTVIQYMYHDINPVGVTAALLIMAIWLVYLLWLDIFERERLLPTALVLLGGMIFAFPGIWIYDFYHHVLGFDRNGKFFNDLFYCIFGIGLIEEFVKLLPLLIIVKIRGRNLDTYDYLFFAAVSALGFSFAENLMYFDSQNAPITGRALTSCVGHMFFSCVAAYGLVLARFKKKKNNPIGYLFLSWLFAACAHGVYDFLLFSHFSLIFLVGFLMSVLIWIILINNTLNNSMYFNYRISLVSEKLMLFVSLSLVVVLVFEYVAKGWLLGQETANDLLYGTIILYGMFILFFTSNLTQFDLIKGYWRKVRFETEGEKVEIYSPIDIFYYLKRFFDLNTQYPQNFVGMDIEMKAHPNNQQLTPHIQSHVKGKFIDRIILDTIGKDGKVFQDSRWFLVALFDPINVTGYLNDHVLIRFQNVDVTPDYEKKQWIQVLLIPKSEVLSSRHLDRNSFTNYGLCLLRFEAKN